MLTSFMFETINENKQHTSYTVYASKLSEAKQRVRELIEDPAIALRLISIYQENEIGVTEPVTFVPPEYKNEVPMKPVKDKFNGKN